MKQIVSLLFVCLLLFSYLVEPTYAVIPSQYSFVDSANQSAEDILYNSEFNLFREAPSQPYSYWIDDHAKLLRSFNLEYEKYSSDAQIIVDFIKNRNYGGWMPRRWMDTQPQVLENSHGAWDDPPNKNLSISNQLYRIDGVPNLGYKDPEKVLRVYTPIEPTLKLGYLQASNFEFKTGTDDPTISSVNVHLDAGVAQSLNNAGFDGDYYDPWQADPAVYTIRTYIREDPSFQFVNGISTNGKLLATVEGSSQMSVPTSNTEGTLSVSWFQDQVWYPIQNNKPYMIWGTTSAAFQYESRSDESDICGYQPANDTDTCIPSHDMQARLTIGFVQYNGNIFTLDTGSWQGVTVSGASSFTVSASFTGLYNNQDWGPHSTFVCNRQPFLDALYMRLDIQDIPLRQNQTKYPGQYNVVDIKYNTISSYADWGINYNLPDTPTGTYNSPQKALKLYVGDTNQASKDVQQTFSFQVDVDIVKSFWWWDYTASSTSYTMKILYDDSSSTSFNTTASSTWTLHTHSQSELDAGKNVTGIRFETTASGPVYIDDITFNFNYGSTTSYIESTSSSVSLVEEFDAPKINVKVKYTLSQNSSYVLVSTNVTNKASETIYDIKVRNALDGLDTLGAGYKYIYFPGYGWEEPGNQTPYEFRAPSLVSWRYNYMVVGIQRIPDWIGSYGVGVIIDPSIFEGTDPQGITFTKVINTRYFNSSSAPSPEGFLHWLQFEHSLPPISAGQSASYNMRWVFMTDWDWTNPSLYDQFFGYDNIENTRFKGLDFSNNLYYGEIIYELVNNFVETGDLTTLRTAGRTWNYYWRMLNAQSMGTYVPSLAQFIRASIKLYDLTLNSTYLSAAYDAADQLKDHQVTTPQPQDDPGVVGTFRMKGELVMADGRKLNETSYLDVTAVSIIALKEVYERTGNTNYLNSVNLGLSAIHYGPPPDSFTLLPLGVEDAVPNPNLPRIWIYANGTHIDHDYSTYKAFLTMQAALGFNNTLTWISLSRFWQRTAHNSSITEIHTGEWSSPNIEMNSETQPWGVEAWYNVATWMASNFDGAFIEFIDFPDNDNQHLIDNVQWFLDAGVIDGKSQSGRRLEITVSSVGSVKFRVFSPTRPTTVLYDGADTEWAYNDGTGIVEVTKVFSSTHTLSIIWMTGGSIEQPPAPPGEFSILPLYITAPAGQSVTENLCMDISDVYSTTFTINTIDFLGSPIITLNDNLPRTIQNPSSTAVTCFSITASIPFDSQPGTYPIPVEAQAVDDASVPYSASGTITVIVVPTNYMFAVLDKTVDIGAGSSVDTSLTLDLLLMGSLTFTVNDIQYTGDYAAWWIATVSRLPLTIEDPRQLGFYNLPIKISVSTGTEVGSYVVSVLVSGQDAGGITYTDSAIIRINVGLDTLPNSFQILPLDVIQPDGTMIEYQLLIDLTNMRTLQFTLNSISFQGPYRTWVALRTNFPIAVPNPDVGGQMQVLISITTPYNVTGTYEVLVSGQGVDSEGNAYVAQSLITITVGMGLPEGSEILGGLAGAAAGAALCFAFAGPFGAIVCALLGFFGFLGLAMAFPNIALILALLVLMLDVIVIPPVFRRRSRYR